MGVMVYSLFIIKLITMNVKSPLILLYLLMPLFALAQLTGYAAIEYDEDAPAAPDARIHLHVDKVPLFQGCKQPNTFTLEEQFCSIEKIKSFIAENLQYPDAAKAAGITGKVTLRAIIEIDGTVSGARIMKSDAIELEEEAIRVVTSMPKFTPAALKEQTVRAFKEITVEFK